MPSVRRTLWGALLAGLMLLAAAGATAVIQPGGSVRDAEVIEAADAAGLAGVAGEAEGEAPAAVPHLDGLAGLGGIGRAEVAAAQRPALAQRALGDDVGLRQQSAQVGAEETTVLFPSEKGRETATPVEGESVLEDAALDRAGGPHRLPAVRAQRVVPPFGRSG